MTDLLDDPIIEGFICPICVTSFRTAEVLQAHFRSQHTPSVTSSDLDTVVPNSVSRVLSHAFYANHGGIQASGCSRSLTSEFLKLRQQCVNRDAMETNSLLIRLDKLISAPVMPRKEWREFEQSIVPWIDAKVSLCPSCGKTFGLGAEPAFVLDDLSSASTNLDANKNHSRAQSIALRSKLKLSQLTAAILDYNPVFRRRHHCRLCGHVLCADCSYFLTKSHALYLLSATDERYFGRMSYDCDSTDSAYSVAQSFPNDVSTFFLPASDYAPSLIDENRSETSGLFLRICSVCKNLLERKVQRLKKYNSILPIVQLHQELKTLMAKVDESAPSYAAVAESLHSGEQRYALEIAKSMRQGLLESLLKIDNIRRQMELMITKSADQDGDVSTASMCASSVRLIRAISNMTRRYLQNNLPPLRVLPTFEQYDCLTAQRQEGLTSHWAKEDQLIAELEISLANKPKEYPGEQMQPECNDAANQLLKLATSIDDVSKRLMSARRTGNTCTARSLTAELERLETRFQSLSRHVQTQLT